MRPDTLSKVVKEATLDTLIPIDNLNEIAEAVLSDLMHRVNTRSLTPSERFKVETFAINLGSVSIELMRALSEQGKAEWGGEITNV